MDLSANSDDSDEEGWEETEEPSEPTKCLFCETMDNSIEDSLVHLQNSHNFYLGKLKAKFQMDQYSFIKVGYLKRDTYWEQLRNLFRNTSLFNIYFSWST